MPPALGRPATSAGASALLWAGVLYLVTFPLFLLFYLPGAIAWVVISIWFLYRIVLGMVRMNAGRPVEA